MKKPVDRKSFFRMLVSGLILMAVSGCSDGKDEGNGTVPDGSSTDQQSLYLPYSLKFDLKGSPVVVDEKGLPVKLEAAELPLRSTGIESIQTFTSVIYKGSCKQAFNMGGKIFVVELPDSYCKQL